MSTDPLEERRLRLERAEREARGDFSEPSASSSSRSHQSSSSSYSSSASSSKPRGEKCSFCQLQAWRKDNPDAPLSAGALNSTCTCDKLGQRSLDEEWMKYKRGDEEINAASSANAQLNAQHNNFRAQAKIDQGIMALLDTSLPRQER